MFRRIRQAFKRTRKNRRVAPTSVLQRVEHNLSRSKISPNALKVMYRLKNAGYSAYIVGGGVRDLLLNQKPKDFDVVTNARPEKVRRLFRNSRIIGRRFLLVHVYYPNEIIEVSTFRATGEEFANENNNVYGTIEEDAWRRDFSINALYYNVADFSIVDYTGGITDLNNRTIRMIGDPVQRYHEDPIRLLRAIRLAAKLNLKIHSETKKPLSELMHLIQHVPMARVYDEFLKLYFDGKALVTHRKLYHAAFYQVLFPQTQQLLQRLENKHYRKLIRCSMKSMDERFQSGKPVNPGFLFAVLLWPSFENTLNQHLKSGRLFFRSIQLAIDQVIQDQKILLAIPKRLKWMIKGIWLLQYHLVKRRQQRVNRLFHHRYFRAAIDFLELRNKASGVYHSEVIWWREFQTAPDEVKKQMIESLDE